MRFPMPQNLRLSASAFIGRGEKAREQSEFRGRGSEGCAQNEGKLPETWETWAVGCVLDQIHVPGIGSRALISAVGPVGTSIFDSGPPAYRAAQLVQLRFYTAAGACI